jgi:putative phosphoesterase
MRIDGARRQPLASMMRVAALYDIHGNLPALEAVLADVQAAAVDHILVGGDVFPGPMAREVLQLLRTLTVPTSYIRGNGDRSLVDIAGGRESAGLPDALVPLFEWHAAQLDAADVETVARWPLTETLSVASNRVLFCHATPRDDNEMFNATTPVERIAPAFAAVREQLVVCGHTHRQFDRTINDRRVVNAGSVGMPFGATDAQWLLLGESAEFRSTVYDRAVAARRVMATDYPRKDEFIQLVLA